MSHAGHVSGCTWPLAGRLAGRTCGRDLVSPRSSFCAAHHNLNRETTMGRRDEDEELEEDLDEAEELEDDEDDEEPAPRRAAKVKAAPAKAAKKTRAQPSQKGVPKPSPAAVRALDLEIFSAADILEVSLGRTPTRAEIAAKAKVPGPTDEARRQRVSAAMRRRGLLDAPAKKPSSGAAAKKVQVPRVSPEAVRACSTLTTGAAPGVRAVEALRDRLRGQLAAVEVTLAALRGES